MTKRRTPTTAYGYARVSTAGQVENGVSLDAQIAAIEAEAKRRGLTLGGMFTDEGVSGRRKDRVGFAAAIDATTKSRGVLISYSLSRLSRSSVQTLQLVESLDRAGAHLVLLQENIDTTGPCGRMVLGVLASVHQHLAEVGAETTSAVLRHVRASGRKTGGSVPFGFTADADGNLAENPDEQRIIARMRELRGQGVSYRRIVAALDAEGLRPRGLRSNGEPSSGRWHLRQVVRLLATDARVRVN